MEGVFDPNQCLRKSTSGEISMRILTNSKCMADELHLKFECQKTRRTSRDGNISFLVGRKSRDGNVSFPRHGASGDWYSLEWPFLMCKNMAKEVRMKKMNLVPIMALQSSATVANGHLSDKWHDPEIAAGERLEAWDDLTGLPFNQRLSLIHI